MTIRLAIAVAVCWFCCMSEPPAAAEPNWSSSVLPIGAEAQQIRQMDILNRPYRPGHFYGNTVRRMHYRGRPWPLPRDFGRAGGALFRRR